MCLTSRAGRLAGGVAAEHLQKPVSDGDSSPFLHHQVDQVRAAQAPGFHGGFLVEHHVPGSDD
jgi:hypothetical protein